MGDKMFEKFNLENAHGLLIDPQISKHEDIREIQEMKLLNDDIIVVAYPKCGLTWTEYIVWGILNHGSDPPSFKDMNTKHFPFMEITGLRPLKNMPKPRTMKFHSPYHLTPTSSKAKFIVVFRNPFDCCVSYFHHLRQRYSIVLGQVVTFERIFELFLKGEVIFGDYFDFVQSWYKRRNEPNVLCLFFEQMKQDHEGTVLKIAKFLGEEYAEELQVSPNTLENILRHSSFKYMKENLELDHFITINKAAAQKINKVEFFRKGEVGDWKTLFTEEQTLRLQQKFEEKLNGTEFRKLLLPPSIPFSVNNNDG